MICFWAGFQVSVESPLLACSQGSCGLLVKEQGAAQASRLCRAGQCENAASNSHYGEMAHEKEWIVICTGPHCVSTIDNMALKILSCGHPWFCSVCRVRSQLWLCALILGFLSSLSGLLLSFFFFFVPPSISGLFFVLVTCYGDRDLAEPPEPYGSSASRTASVWVTATMSCCHGWSLSAQCLESKFDIGTEQQKQERAQSGRELSQGESSASCPRGITGRAGDMSSSPYPAHVTPTPQLSHLLIHFPRAQSCQLLELAELHMQDVAQLPGAQPVLVATSPGTKSPLTRLSVLWQCIG